MFLAGSWHTLRMSESREEPRARARATMREAGAKTAGVLATIARLAGSLAALVLVIYIVLFIGEASPENSITSFFRSLADGLTLGFRDLFTPEGEKTRVFVNYGLAAVFWLVAGAVVSRIITRLAT